MGQEYVIKFQFAENMGPMSIKRELKMLEKVHEKEGEGTKFIVKPLFGFNSLGE